VPHDMKTSDIDSDLYSSSKIYEFIGQAVGAKTT